MLKGRYARPALATMLCGTALTLVVSACGNSGTSNGGSSSQGKTINIGVESTLSGSLPVPGYAYGNEAYFRALDAKGGVAGYKIKYFVADTANSGPQTVTVSRNLVSSDHISALISFGTVPADALLPIQTQLGVPILISSDGDSFIPGKAYQYDAVPSYHAMWKFAVGLVKSRFSKSGFAYAYQSDAFGQPLPDVAAAAAQADGLKVLASVPVPTSTTSDFTPYAAKLKASGAPVVILGMGPSLIAGVIKASTALGYNPIWLSNWGIEGPSVVSAIGSAAQNAYAVDYFPPEATTNTPAYQAYKQAMSKYYPSDVSDQFAMQGWTYAAIVTYAIQQAAKSGKGVTATTINAALSSITNQSVGLLPTLSYNAQEHNGVTEMTLLGYQGGAWHQLLPFTKLPSP